MAAVQEFPDAVSAAAPAFVVALARHAYGEALGRGGGGAPRAQEGAEGEIFVSSKEGAEVLPVVGAETAQEAGVGDEAVPAGADEGRAGERGRPRWQAEEDLGEEVVDIHRGSRRRRRPEHEPAKLLVEPSSAAVPCPLARSKINGKWRLREEALAVHGHGRRRRRRRRKRFFSRLGRSD
jgi:hypothetical protein